MLKILHGNINVSKIYKSRQKSQQNMHRDEHSNLEYTNELAIKLEHYSETLVMFKKHILVAAYKLTFSKNIT